MIFESLEFEFRGSSTKQNENGTYLYVNLEDTFGDNVKFNTDISQLNTVNSLKKGDKVLCFIEYSSIYKSMKLLQINKLEA